MHASNTFNTNVKDVITQLKKIKIIPQYGIVEYTDATAVTQSCFSKCVCKKISHDRIT